MLRFKPDKVACKDGPTYVGSTEDGKCHMTLVSDGSTTAFAASVTCEDTGAVYSIGTDGSGTMTVVERWQADFGEELDAFDELPVEERALLEARIADTNSANNAAVSSGGLRGKRFLTENHHSDTVHRDLQGNIIIDAMVLYTADAECGNAGLPLGCVRTPTREASIRSKIDLAIAETNTAYLLSGVKVALNLVHAAYDDYVETDDTGTTLHALPAKPSVHALCQAYGADVVAMIVGRGQYCGVGYNGPSIGSMYSVSHYSCATGYYTFGHEIGHNFGLNHDRGSKNQCTTTGYNYDFAILRLNSAQSLPMPVMQMSVLVIYCQRELPAPESNDSPTHLLSTMESQLEMRIMMVLGVSTTWQHKYQTSSLDHPALLQRYHRRCHQQCRCHQRRLNLRSL